MSPDGLHIDTSLDAWNGRGITVLTLQTPTSTAAGKSPSPKPSRWRTTEFLVYGVIAAVVIPYMIYVPIRLSQPWQPNYSNYEYKLSPGWIAGRKVDNSDHQYRNFRNNLLPLLSLALGYLGTSYLYTRFSNTRRILTGKRSDNLLRVPFIVGFALCMLLGLHGASALKILAVLGANYWIGKATAGTVVGPVISWTFNLGVLIMNELADGYEFATLHPSLAYLDTLKGFYPRWHVTFNITMLRLVSFNMDYHWACTRKKSQNAREDSIPLNMKQRCAMAHSLDSYNSLNYFVYVVYPPLYIAGPIMTFNDFYWQLRRPIQIERSYTISYLLRFLFCLLTMEFILHFMYVVAIKDTRTWRGASSMELSMVGFWNLIIVWLKLLLLWRFFRSWALADGMEPVENVVRCMANNYSAAGFWRGWHRSYNQWLIRYIYIPVGGRGSGILATMLVFTFVALWHDLTFRLLAWGGLISLFILPEMLLARTITAEKFGSRPWYRHVCALGGVANVLMMVTGNLVGFVIGIEGMKYLVGEIFGTWYGLQFLVVVCGVVFVGVQLMFEYREEEMRRGIYRNY